MLHKSTAASCTMDLIRDLMSKAYLEDICAMKLNAIASDGTRVKDFIDLYYLSDIFSIEEMLSFFAKKYNTRNTFHVLKSICYFEEVNLSDWPEMVKDPTLDWDHITTVILRKCRLFESGLNKE